MAGKVVLFHASRGCKYKNMKVQNKRSHDLSDFLAATQTASDGRRYMCVSQSVYPPTNGEHKNRNI